MRVLRTLVTLLAAAIKEKSKENDPIVDWKPPSQNEIKETRRRFIEPMKSLTSAMFFSTDQEGNRHESLQKCMEQLSLVSSPNNVNDQKQPILFVSNHQLVGLDSWLVVNEIWNSGIFVRAMIHPLLSPTNNDDGPTLPGGSLYNTFGCLPVSPRNFYKLMKANQPSLLFPGGARESFHRSNEQYTLTAWSEESDFVRTAAKFGATIVPFSSVGAAESAIFLDQLLPFGFADSVNNALLQAASKNQAPFNARYDAGKEQISFPLVIPKPLPSRHYFLFGTPLDLASMNVSHKDKNRCQIIYRDVKQSIKQGCIDLLRAKKRDPFNDPMKRLAYEQFWRKQAPTFPINTLN